MKLQYGVSTFLIHALYYGQLYNLTKINLANNDVSANSTTKKLRTRHNQFKTHETKYD